jgi:hypothetical protein
MGRLKQGDGERPYPGIDVGDLKGARLEHLHHLGIDLHRRTPQAPAIEAQEHAAAAKLSSRPA